MKNNNHKIYDKMKLLLCREWKISPMEFDKMQKNGEILLKDAIGTIEAAMFSNPFAAQSILTYLYGDKLEKRKKEKEALSKRKRELESFYRLLCDVVPRNKHEEERLEINKKATLDELKKLQETGELIVSK